MPRNAAPNAVAWAGVAAPSEAESILGRAYDVDPLHPEVAALFETALVEADLDGAYLGEAELDGADLRGKPWRERRRYLERVMQRNRSDDLRIVDIALLPTQRNYYGQDTLDKTAAGRTLAAETTLAPDNTPAQGLLSGVVGRFNPFLVDKGPQGRLALETVTAGGLGLPMLDQERAQLQQAFDFAPNRAHCFLERLAVKVSSGRCSPGSRAIALKRVSVRTFAILR